LYKGGDCSQFDNYRGITVGPVLAKVFVMILEFILLTALMSEMPRPGVFVCHFIVLARTGHDSNQVVDSTT
jgi:hypothetical protein